MSIVTHINGVNIHIRSKVYRGSSYGSSWHRCFVNPVKLFHFSLGKVSIKPSITTFQEFNHDLSVADC